MSVPHKNHSKKLHAVFLVIFLIAIFIFSYAVSTLKQTPNENTRYGVTFSSVYAQSLGLNVEKTYKKILNELEVKAVRLPIYWSSVEKEDGILDWKQVDRLVTLSEENNVKLTIVTGVKVPRWPECFVPNWAEVLSRSDRHQAALDFIETTVNRYKDSPALERWQVENEPFFPFGICEEITQKEFSQRVELVKKLDNHPIQLTVSGELGPWKNLAKQSDILGISLYRKTYNDIFGYFIYPLSPEYYFFRARLVSEEVDKVIVSELQAEPWFSGPIESRPLTEWAGLFNKDDFQNQVEFVKNAKLDEVYFWGVEWWEYLRQKGNSSLWNEAKKLF